MVSGTWSVFKSCVLLVGFVLVLLFMYMVELDVSSSLLGHASPALGHPWRELDGEHLLVYVYRVLFNRFSLKFGMSLA